MLVKKFESKEESRSVRFVQDAASKDKSRSVLTGIHVGGGQIAAADGFRLHVAPVPEVLEEEQGKTLKPVRRVRVTPQPEEFQEDGGTYPDFTQIMPKEEPLFTFVVNKDYIKDLGGMPTGDDPNKRLIFKFTSNTSPLLIEALETDHKAVIMPCHHDAPDQLQDMKNKIKQLEEENKLLREQL